MFWPWCLFLLSTRGGLRAEQMVWTASPSCTCALSCGPLSTSVPLGTVQSRAQTSPTHGPWPCPGCSLYAISSAFLSGVLCQLTLVGVCFVLQILPVCLSVYHLSVYLSINHLSVLLEVTCFPSALGTVLRGGCLRNVGVNNSAPEFRKTRSFTALHLSATQPISLLLSCCPCPAQAPWQSGCLPVRFPGPRPPLCQLETFVAHLCPSGVGCVAR